MFPPISHSRRHLLATACQLGESFSSSPCIVGIDVGEGHIQPVFLSIEGRMSRTQHLPFWRISRSSCCYKTWPSLGGSFPFASLQTSFSQSFSSSFQAHGDSVNWFRDFTRTHWYKDSPVVNTQVDTLGNHTEVVMEDT